jgi:hypothetical protein
MVDAARHTFRPDLAHRYEPRSGFTKTAILVETVDPEVTTVIQATFGQQTLHGSFYVVAEGDSSYGASHQEFEQTHDRAGQNQWTKRESVLGYQATEPCKVETYVSGGHEGTVPAKPGDWIVQQATGEVMVIEAEAFAIDRLRLSLVHWLPGRRSESPRASQIGRRRGVTDSVVGESRNERVGCSTPPVGWRFISPAGDPTEEATPRLRQRRHHQPGLEPADR